MPLITVITPTFNRATLLPRLYESLCRQTCKDFEWIVVDDGSTDNTQEVLAQLLGITNHRVQSAGFKVQYYRKENGGKHTAVNLGVTKAQGKLTIILDSDDELPATSIEEITEACTKIKDSYKSKKPIGGVCGYMAHRNGDIIGMPMLDAVCDETDMRYLYGVRGDMCEVFYTNVLRGFPFPEIKGERFCPESLVWNRIAQKYSLLVFSKVIYLRDYLDGGLTDNIVRIRMHSPIASMMTYAEMLGYCIPFKEKVKSAINYWRFRCCYRRTEENKDVAIPRVSSFWSLFVPFGLLFHLKDKRTVGKKNM